MAAELSDPKTPMPLPPPPSLLPTLPVRPPARVDPDIFSLYVGDLDPQVTEEDLLATFRFMGPIASVRLCRDSHSGESLRYGYVNFYSHSHASKAMACLNHTELKGKTMRIMWSQRDSVPRKTGLGNVFVKNLDPEITSTHLQDMFREFGTILSCKVAEQNGKSKGFGFVQFNKEESAVAAVNALNDTIIKGKKLYVSKFVKKSDRIPAQDESKFTNLFVKNLAEHVTEDLLRELFSQYGSVYSLAIMKDEKGKSKGFGFANFESPEEAKKAVEGMNGALLGSKHLFVGRAQKKAEREKFLKCKEEMLNSEIKKLKSMNLYVKNLAESVDDIKLGEHCSAFGKILSAKVMRDGNGMSRGFGFVCFSTLQEAAKALSNLNGAMLEGRKLYVAVAQSKDHRCKAMQDYYTLQLPQRSLQSPNWPALHLVQYSVSPRPPTAPLLCPPVMYQSFGTNVDADYPSVLSRQAQWGSSNGNDNFQNKSRTYANSSVHTNSGNHGGYEATGYRKKVYRQSGATAGSSRSATTDGRALLTEGSSTGNSNLKTTPRDRHHSFVENLEPGRAVQITGTSGMLWELNSSEKAAAQVLKVANGTRTSADHHPVFAKSGRYLS
ncbi:polyadenylate-binding protein 6-like [Pyrus communis]|uniref:polyadenylate-binding protein 6-like n=1 Tax=Pyrus communis TaxID=23211 RepID=UPI0035BF44D6